VLKLVRRLHLYLGVFFAPLLLFFVLSGWYQTANPDRRKGPDEARAFWDRMRSVHAEQILPDEKVDAYSPKLMRWFIYGMSLALVATVALGVVLALKVLKARWLVWVMLALGFAVPALLLWIGQSRGTSP
jgi:hypothetical protein